MLLICESEDEKRSYSEDVLGKPSLIFWQVVVKFIY